MLKNMPVRQETWVWSLGQANPLEKGLATHSSILACSIPWTEEPGALHSPWGHKESDRTERLTFTFFHVEVGSLYVHFLESVLFCFFFLNPKWVLDFADKNGKKKESKASSLTSSDGPLSPFRSRQHSRPGPHQYFRCYSMGLPWWLRR